jgi:hypothetical protein
MDNSLENVDFQGCCRFILSCFQLDEAKGIKGSLFYGGEAREWTAHLWKRGRKCLI